MNDFEQELGSMPLAAPSADLDRRMSDTFSAAARTAPSSRRTSFWWWLGAAAVAGAAAAALLLLSRPQPPPIRPIVYRLEAQGRLRELLLTPPASRASPPPMVVRTNPS